MKNPKTKFASNAKLIAMLKQLEPISRLSIKRIHELVDLCVIDDVSQDLDALRMRESKLEAIYLVSGALGLRYEDGHKEVLEAHTDRAKFQIASQYAGVIKYTKALTPVRILRVDADLLDILLTWDQLSNYESGEKPVAAPAERIPLTQHNTQWLQETKSFSAANLQNGIFSRLPPAHIQEMYRRMELVEVKAGKVLMRQGQEGDFYYVIQRGKAEVVRYENDQDTVLAQLGENEVFGEEALVSENRRNATVTMLTDGILLRLSKVDFVHLVKTPLVQAISLADAQAKVAQGAVWLDVRLASEFKFGAMPNAVSLPLNELRALVKDLDISKAYVVYCQSGRRSAAAAFLLTQLGFQVEMLLGGTSAKA